MNKRVRTLLRVSSKQQLHDDDIPIQRAEAKRYIESRPDWTFDMEYVEKAVSAYKNSVEDRVILQKILADAKNKDFDILLTYMSDRIGRKEEYSVYIAALNKLGIEVWTIKDGQLKTEEHIDKLLNFIRFWQNEGESKKTGMRVRDAQKELVQAGRFVGGNAPFGYRLVLSGEISSHGRALHKLEIVPKDAVVVKRIYSLAVRQGMGAGKIAKQLDKEGVPAITTDTWRSGTVSGILKNPVYMGYPAIGRRSSKGRSARQDREKWIYSKEQQKELAIISPAEWMKAQEIREARKRRLDNSKNLTQKLYSLQQDPFPFSTSGKLPLIGIAYCGYCKKKLKNASYYNRWYSKKEGKEKVSFAGRYQCPDRCPKRSSYSQKYLEGIVFEILDGYLAQLKSIDIYDKINMIQREKEKLIQTEIRDLEKQKETLQKDILTLSDNIPLALRGVSVFSAEKLSELMADKEQKQKEITVQINKKKELIEANAEKSKMLKFFSVIPDWKKEFRAADPSTQQMILASLIERIDVKDDSIRIRFRISPKSPFSPW